ncbi:Bug family tripartite tricarboxylate transporter substrate binding protein [Phytohabitans rumicis]|uniref:C4-dicarboxylate ABC transporter substrate-binding protein n=1 Tax=Phytohabitans rumicis TaxID=1076125 RepID=A0A6V8LHB9_9ACTN|nr:tripartite tricarboxylate transporter substrate binding protein [Phytohabitans rumicis]GFJ95040.1 C4-dicarboxylate ABC transporter substrate-binding protein [Phytohabitans rumicis]
MIERAIRVRQGVLAFAAGVPLVLGATACADGGNSVGTKSETVEYPTSTIRIMAPASPGGGWDLTARTMQKSLKDASITSQAVEVDNVAGAAGTIGLAQLVSKHKADPHRLMVTGLVMVGGVVTNKSAVSLSQTTPIATLTAEAEVIVVPSKSKYKTLQELVADLKADPSSINWGGGSAGGTDQILVGLLAKAAGVDPKLAKYTPYSGGGETKAALLSGDLSVGVSSVSEFKDLVKDGQVRALAVSGAKGVDAGAGTPAPTIKEAGYDVELMNWRGVVAPPDVTDAQRQAIVSMVDKLHQSLPWQQVLTDQGWEDFYKSGDEAKQFFESETTRITAVLSEIGLASK